MISMFREEWEGPIRVRWFYDTATDEVTVERWQDSRPALEMVAAVNAEGAKTLDGLGRPVMEIDQVEAMGFCEKRGIPWEKFLYSNEYDDELRRFAQEHTKLCYEARRTVHAVS